MPERTLRECRILIVEDEYMLADELRMELEEAGAIVLGPVPSIDEAADLIRSEEHIDGGILDVNLDGEKVFPVADLLTDRNVPFVFTTGYDRSALPKRFVQVVRCEKPVNMKDVARAIGRVVHN